MKHKSVVFACIAAMAFNMCAAPIVSLAAEEAAVPEKAVVTEAELEDEIIVETYGKDGYWYLENGYWKYNPNDGVQSYAVGSWNIDGVNYAFDDNGYLGTGGWIKGEGDWFYTDSYGVVYTGWQLIDGYWYYFDEYGYMYVYGAYFINGCGYNFAAGGQLYTNGWYQNGEYTDNTSSWYYSNASGLIEREMLVNEDGKWSMAEMSTGERIRGWQLIDGEWYYFNCNGHMLRNTAMYIDGIQYVFGPYGTMITNGWMKDGDFWIYLLSDGSLATGWQLIDGYWYYFNTSGHMYDSGIYVIDNTRYIFSPSGNMLTDSWVKDGDEWCYADSYGVAVTGWQVIGGYWYYFDKYGHIFENGAYIINGYWYNFSEGGQLYTNSWNPANNQAGNWFYSNASGHFELAVGYSDIYNSYYGYDVATGADLTGWYYFDGYYYYFNNKGEVLRDGFTEIDGYYYAFGPYANMLTGWVKAGSSDWAYASESGALVKGWQLINGYYYYFDKNYIMYADAVHDIDGYSYSFGPSGNMYVNDWVFCEDVNAWIYAGESGALLKSDWYLIDGSWYLFDEQGLLVG